MSPAVLVTQRPVRTWQSYAAQCLLLWHLCSLDAPTVAVVWALALARLAAVTLHPALIAVLALGTWIVYVLDRVLDTAHTSALLGDATLKERHHFHHRHRSLLLSLCALAGIALAILAFTLASHLVLLYLALGVPVGVYAVAIHWPRRAWTRRPHSKRLGMYKEAAVAALFTAAVAAPAFVAASPARRPALAFLSLLLALLCWLNCALISYVEASEGRRAGTYPPLIAGAIAVAAGAALASTASRAGWCIAALQPPCAAVLLSALFLLGLLLTRSAALPKRRVRILADLALLTPLLFLLPRA